MTLSSPQLPKVLLVEDAEDNAFVLQHVLGTEFDVQVAHTAEEAYSLAQASAFDVAVIDLLLPKRDGIWLLQQLRRDSRSANVRALSISASPSGTRRPGYEDAGFDAFMVKPPPSLEALREAVRRLVALGPRAQA